ncbi:MAG: DUF1624 domain-containing protein [Proteobacteria bacterium]|nr:DUF1624 domain-containing protein [Pseudomonadota bacterium]
METRDPSIDALRGLAILIMVGANLSPILPAPHPLAYRFWASLAAPLFVTLAGAMVGLNLDRHPLRYFLVRGALIFLIGALLDAAAWKLIPFMGFNVLYLIGLSLPLAALAGRLSSPALAALAAAWFLLTPALQIVWGYSEVPTEILLQYSGYLKPGHALDVARQWLVDGYFPIFPWTGFVLAGLLAARVRWSGPAKKTAFPDARAMKAGTGAVAAGAVLWLLYPGPLYERFGYSELFYPAVPGFITIMIGLLILALGLVDRSRSWPGWRILRPLGQASLFMYIFHELVLRRLLFPWRPRITYPQALLALTLLVSIMILLGLALRRLRARRRLPLPLRLLLGG